MNNNNNNNNFKHLTKQKTCFYQRSNNEIQYINEIFYGGGEWLKLI